MNQEHQKKMNLCKDFNKLENTGVFVFNLGMLTLTNFRKADSQCFVTTCGEKKETWEHLGLNPGPLT